MALRRTFISFPRVDAVLLYLDLIIAIFPVVLLSPPLYNYGLPLATLSCYFVLFSNQWKSLGPFIPWLQCTLRVCDKD